MVVGPTRSAPFNFKVAKPQESDPFLSTSLERVTHVAQVVTSTCDFPDLSIQNSWWVSHPTWFYGYYQDFYANGTTALRVNLENGLKAPYKIFEFKKLLIFSYQI